MTNVEDIGSIIERAISDIDKGYMIETAKVFNHWPKIVGEGISDNCKPKKIYRDTLYVSVKNSTWASELNLMSNQLVEKINTYIGKTVVKEIRFRADLE